MPVIDASALAGWLLPDEAGPDISSIFAQGQAIAPWLLWVELRNILVVIERKGRIEESETNEILAAVDALGISLDSMADSDHVMALARRHGLTVYDSTYLELALRRRQPITSLDKTLIAAAGAEEVEIL